MVPAENLVPVLDQLCPMYVLLDRTGHIRQVGPTLQKLHQGRSLAGQRFLEVFELTRPRDMRVFSDLVASSGVRLRLHFRDDPGPSLKGLVVPLPDRGGAIVNLSFGISVLEAVREYALTAADFAVTDLTVEMLYLVEAKSAAMEASRTLNQRLQGAMIAAEEQAFTDTLTGLKNRRATDHVLDRLTRRGAAFALIHLDLDYFKSVNDTMGHAAGDHVLQEAARIMVDVTRDADTVGRVGGDEFVIILDAVRDKSRLSAIARRLIDRLEEPVPFADQWCRISASIGITVTDGSPGAGPAALLHQADTALYAAKAAGRGCHRFFDAEQAALPGGDDAAPPPEQQVELQSPRPAAP